MGPAATPTFPSSGMSICRVLPFAAATGLRHSRPPASAGAPAACVAFWFMLLLPGWSGSPPIEGSGRNGRITFQDVYQAIQPDARPALKGAATVYDESDRIFASPLARRLAALHGIDLAALTGTGARGRISKADVLAKVPAQPVAVKYGAKGNAQAIVAFGPREHFMGNFLRLLGEPGRVVEVHFLEPVAASEDGRRRMADTCRERIAAAMSNGAES